MVVLYIFYSIVYLHLPVNTHGSGRVMWLYCMFIISLSVYIYQLIPMVAAVSLGCVGAAVYTIYAAVTKTDVRFVNTIIII